MHGPSLNQQAGVYYRHDLTTTAMTTCRYGGGGREFIQGRGSFLASSARLYDAEPDATIGDTATMRRLRLLSTEDRCSRRCAGITRTSRGLAEAPDVPHSLTRARCWRASPRQQFARIVRRWSTCAELIRDN